MPVRAPLTFQQRWLLELVQKYPLWHCAAGYTFNIQGELDLELLQRNVVEVVRRHGSLRTRIMLVDGCAEQLIDDSGVFRLEVIRVTGRSPMEIERNALRVAESIYDLRFDPFVAPPWSITVLRLSDREHWLILVMHRLIAECASIERVFQEIRALYEEQSYGKPSAFSPSPPQYSDYAWAQQKNAAEWFDRHEGYWNKRLADATGVCWPSDAELLKVERSTLGKTSCPLGGELSTKLHDLARTHRTLSPTLMLAVYVVTLWRWCGQTDFVVPFNVAGRQSEHRPVVGFFAYALFLRIGFSESATFLEVVDQIGKEFYRALSHQDFGRVAVRRPDLIAGTLFQWITWHPDDVARASASSLVDTEGLSVSRLPIRDFGQGLTVAPPSVVDVEVTLFDAPEGLCALGTYRADRFASATIQRFMDDFRDNAQALLHNPRDSIALR